MQVNRYVLAVSSAVQDFIARHRLASGITLVIAVAILLTTINMWLYVHSGASGLDLSRPGYDVVRENIRSVKNEPTFAAEGPLTTEIIDFYLTDFRSEKIQASQLGTFSPEPLSNEVLDFNVPNIAPSDVVFQ